MKTGALTRTALALTLAAGITTGCDDGDKELKAQIAALTARVEALETTIASGPNLTALSADVADNEARLDMLAATAIAHGTRLDAEESATSGSGDRLTALETKTAGMRALAASDLDNPDGHPAVFFEGVNVYVVNGEGDTETTTGTGNLIVGYNESPSTDPARTGSHTLVLGVDNDYTSFGGFVAGDQNTLASAYGGVFGGGGNTVSGFRSTVLGGVRCEVATAFSTIYGGDGTTASTVPCQGIEP